MQTVKSLYPKPSFVILFFAVYSNFVLVSLERKKQYNLEEDIVFYKIPKRNLL